MGGPARKHRTKGIIWREHADGAGGYWFIDKKIFGQRLRCSSRTDDPQEAEAYLARLVEETRRSAQFGTRPQRTFLEAATKFISEHQHKKSIADDTSQIKRLRPYIGDLPLHQVHMGTLQKFIDDARAAGNKANTINLHLAVVRRILNLCAGTWRDPGGLTWLEHPPKIVLLPKTDQRPPYALSWAEQAKLMNELPPHLHDMALYALNTGCREQEITGLQWEWERRAQGVKNVMFELPGKVTKNGEPRVIVLNQIAAEAVDRQRGLHKTHVFTYQPPTPKSGPNKDKQPERHPVLRINTKAWRSARERAKLGDLHFHDLKHTFGRRLRAAGISKETRSALLGHTTGDITTHYSQAELEELIGAVEAICVQKEGVLLRAVKA